MMSILIVAASVSASTVTCSGQSVIDAARQFTDAYVAGDKATILAIAETDIVIYGTDQSELFFGRSELSRVFDQDQSAWRDSVSIGPLKAVTVAGGCELATTFYSRDFKVGSGRPIPVRFTSAWRFRDGRWRLVQTANAIPTNGQSTNGGRSAPLRP